MKPEMEAEDRLEGRNWLWTACWPNVPEVAAPPPPVSGGAALLPHSPQVSPHFAYREKNSQPLNFFAKHEPPC